MQVPRIAFSDLNAERTLDRLPSFKLDHLYRMTDHTGLLQHAVFSVPNYSEGYATDDNARAFIVAVLMEELGMTALSESANLASRYLAFLWHAFNPATGRFRNFLSYERQWLEATGSEDSHGRALWGLGTVLGRSMSADLRGTAGRLFESALPAILKVQKSASDGVFGAGAAGVSQRISGRQSGYADDGRIVASVARHLRL